MRTLLTLTCASTCYKCEGAGLVFTNSPCGSPERLPHLCPCVRSAPASAEPLELEEPTGKPTVIRVPAGFEEADISDIFAGDHILIPGGNVVAKVSASQTHLNEYYLYDMDSRCIARSALHRLVWVKRE